LSWLNGNLYLSKFITSSNTANRSYTFPNATGTIALTSDISYPVTSVYGRTGAVVATSGDYTTTQVTEGTNLYFTDTRARAAISLTTTGTSGAATYVSGVINIPQYQGVLTNPITGTGTTNILPKFTAASTIGDSNITDTGSLITLGSNSLVNGNLGIGSSSLTLYNLRIARNITGGTSAYAIGNLGVIQSDVTSNAYYNFTTASTAAAAFTLTTLGHYRANQGTFGAGSTVTSQYGFWADNTLVGATNNYGFYGAIPAASNAWNLYMAGTANNYLAGSLGIGSTSLTQYGLRISKNITGSTISYNQFNDGIIQSDVTNQGHYYSTNAQTQATTFTLGTIFHYRAIQGTFGAGSTITSQAGFYVDNTLIGATNNYGFFGNIASGTNRWNLYMNGNADNYLAGNTGIGVSQTIVSTGPILTTTLTSGGSGYVDGTYTDVASTVVSGGGTYALFTIVVSSGIVTTATLTWGGSTYTAGTTLTVSNTLLGGTGSGLVITVNTVDSSQLTIANANGGDITLFRNDTSLSTGENIGTIKWVSNDGTIKASGLQAEIGAFAAGTAGGAYLSFFTRSLTAGTSLVEAMRIDSTGGVGISATTLTGYSLRISKNITGATTAYAIRQDGSVQSDVTSSASNFASFTNTAAASFTLGAYTHFSAQQGTIGAGSSITTQIGFSVTSSMVGATNNYGFYGNMGAGANAWNIYMGGTANNYMAGALGIGATNLTGVNLFLSKTLTGSIDSYHVNVNGIIQSDVTNSATYFRSSASTAAASFTLGTINHYVANQGGLGAGSSVTNQYGFAVNSNLIGATNNFGFWGNIPSGTNRWNLYMAGTAANYMAGQVSIGTATLVATAALNVSSTTQGFLPPVMTTTQKNAIASPATGLVVFDSTLGKLCVFSTTWQTITSV